MEFNEKHSSIIIFPKTSTPKGGRGNIYIELPLINSINNTLSILRHIFHIDDIQTKNQRNTTQIELHQLFIWLTIIGLDFHLPN